MPETAKRTARVPILGEDGRISDDYIPAAIGENTAKAEAAATRAETAATNAEGSATAAGQSAASVADKFIASAQATTLEPGSQATASVADQVLTIGVPRGEKGDKGDTGDQGPQGEPGQDGQDATLPEGMVVADETGALSSLGSDGEPSPMTDVSVVNTASGNSAIMLTSGNSPNVSVMNSQTKAAAGFGLVDGEPVLSAAKPQSGTKVYGFSPTIPEDDTLTVVTSDAYKADTDPLKQRIDELENQAANVVTGTSTDLVAHGEDAYAQKPREVRVKGKTWVNRWPKFQETETRNGVTLTFDETGLFTLSGTATSLTIFSKPVNGLAAGKKVALSKSGGTGFSAFLTVGSNTQNIAVSVSTSNTATGTIASDATVFNANIRVDSGTTVDASFRVMLVDGAEAPDCFTPPVSITSAQPGKLVTSGKNLLPEFTLSPIPSQGVTATLNDDNSITLNGTATGRATFALLGADPFTDVLGEFVPGAYTLSVGSEVAGINFDVMDWREQRSVFAVSTSSSSSFTKTLTNIGEYTYIRVQIIEGTTLNNVTIYPQLELGSTATPYEPPFVTETPLPEVELRSLPNGTCDELVIRADGTCEVERKIGEGVVDAEHPVSVSIVSQASGDNLPYAIVDNVLQPFESSNVELVSARMYSTAWPNTPNLKSRGVYRTWNSIIFVDERFTDKETAQSIINEIGGTFIAQVPATTEPQSPVTLPTLPAPTFNQYHDSPVPSDTSTEYVRDIGIVLANLEAVQTALLGGE